MNESEWLACEDPASMLIHLRGHVLAHEQAQSKVSLHSSAGPLPGQQSFHLWMGA